MPHPFPQMSPTWGPYAKPWLPHQVQSVRTALEEACLLLQDAQHALCLLSETTKPVADRPNEMSVEADGLETLSITQTKEALQVSRSTVYALLNSGALAWTRVGKRRRILRTTIIRYLQSNTQAS